MILTQELWEEYTAAFPNEFSWEELMDAGLTAQACAAANATNWKLEQVLKQNAELAELAKAAANRIEDTKKSHRFLRMIYKATGGE